MIREPDNEERICRQCGLPGSLMGFRKQPTPRNPERRSLWCNSCMRRFCNESRQEIRDADKVIAALALRRELRMPKIIRITEANKRYFAARLHCDVSDIDEMIASGDLNTPSYRFEQADL